MRRLRSSMWLVFSMLVLTAVACSGGHASETVASRDPLPECDRYLAAYRGCFGGLSAEAHRLTEERAATMRAKFLAAAQSDATREATRRQCEDSARALKGACR